jgi:hypothetical protein
MTVYQCYRGKCSQPIPANLRAVVATDASGEPWLCLVLHDGPLGPQEAMAASIGTERAGAILDLVGFEGRRHQHRIFQCEEDGLSAKLLAIPED